MLIDCVSIGACVLSNKSHISRVPSDLAIKKTPGLEGDHSASVTRFPNVFVWSNAPVFSFGLRMIKKENVKREL
jgi:hypothetical protein